MNNPQIRRPHSLKEVAEETSAYGEFGPNLKDFLHEFAFAKQQNRPLAEMLDSEPQRVESRFPEGKICDAFLAATADYLARTNGLPTPAWALNPSRVLDVPWFSIDALELRLQLFRDTPSAFKDKNLFVFESALKVA